MRVTATLKRVSQHNHILIQDVYLEGVFFRDHVWLRHNKRLDSFHPGDRITFTAKLKNYIDSSDINKTKVGLRGIRNVQVVESSFKF